MRISSLSKEYVGIVVDAEASGLAVDPTGDVVEMAFPLTGVDPVSGDWKAAAWDTDASTTPPTYIAQCLVGPGGTIALAKGTYDIWVKVTDSPEIPALQAEHLYVF